MGGEEAHQIVLADPHRAAEAMHRQLAPGDQAPHAAQGQAEPLGHDGETSTFSFGSTTRVIGVTRPGLYRITLPPVNGRSGW